MRPPDVTTPPGAGAALQTSRRGGADRFERNYSKLNSPCKHCGILSTSDVCCACRAWLRVYAGHRAMALALQDAAR